MIWLDYFCGGGLCAAGARAAGYTVAFGQDADSKAVQIFKRNFPDATTSVAKINMSTFDPIKQAQKVIDAHADARAHHHFSPPCTEVSAARRAGRVEDGVRALEWAIEYPMARGYESWSVETVVSVLTRRILDALVVKHTPERVGYLQIEAADLGTPQTRLRYIIGPPQLIARLNARPTVARVSMRAAFTSQNMNVPSTHVKNSSKASKLRSVSVDNR